MRVRLAPHARDDLDSIWGYVARESGDLGAATHVIQAIVGRFRLLSKFPKIGKRFPSERHPQVRTLACANYIIFYNPKAEELRILRVIHAKRDAYAVFLRE
jgi:toxin ParE1/3/4